MTTIKNYSELSKINNFVDRYRYLKLNGQVGRDTFGFDRYLNQMFYKWDEWLSVRNEVIVRDNGCDLGLKGYDIIGSIMVHHMNAITKEDILNRSSILLDPEFLVSTKLSTHNAIHYGDESLLILPMKERTKNDTCPWRQH